MDTTLSEEEAMVRETARKFLETQCPTKLVREMEKDAKGYPPALWKQAAELGWQGLALPENTAAAKCR
jgi:alkylation response protein AidB-like acyl-CoA dehydrogenase